MLNACIINSYLSAHFMVGYMQIVMQFLSQYIKGLEAKLAIIKISSMDATIVLLTAMYSLLLNDTI